MGVEQVSIPTDDGTCFWGDESGDTHGRPVAVDPDGDGWCMRCLHIDAASVIHSRRFGKRDGAQWVVWGDHVRDLLANEQPEAGV